MRKSWVDIAKGISIFLVILIHTVEGIFNAGIGTAGDLWKAFVGIGYSFMVPVFFFFAGFFRKTTGGMVSRIQKILKTLIYPYFLWSLIQFAIKYFLSSGNNALNLGDLSVILTNGFMQFWFLHALIIISLFDISLTFFRVSSQFRLVAALAAVLFGVPYFTTEVFTYGVWTSWIYFEIGLFLRSISFVGRHSHAMAWGGLVALLFFQLGGLGYGTPSRPFAAISGMMFCFGLSQIIASKALLLNRICEYLGKNTLALYVAHIIAAAGVREIMLKYGLSSFPLHVTLGVIAGIGIPLCLVQLDQKLGGGLFTWPAKKGSGTSNKMTRLPSS